MPHESLKIFCAAAEEANFTRAAARLHMSQQTLSNRISGLEREYGVRLFERRPKLRLSAEGELFYRYARETLDRDAVISARFDELRAHHRGRLQLGITQTRALTFLPAVLPGFVRDDPDIILEPHICHISELPEKTASGELDLAIFPGRQYLNDRLDSVCVATDRLRLVIPPHILRTAGADLEELAAQPEPARLEWLAGRGILRALPYTVTGPRLSELVRLLLNSLGVPPLNVRELNGVEVLFALPFAHVSAVFMMESMLRFLPQEQGFISLPVPLSAADIPIHAAWERARGLSWAARKFIDHACSPLAL